MSNIFLNKFKIIFEKIRSNSVPFLILICLSVFLFLKDEDAETSKTAGKVKRVISLSPAITRQITDLESEHLLVGVTSYHPPLTRKIKIVGTLVRPNIEEIVILKPDIVFVSEEDNGVQFIEMLNATDIAVYTFGRNHSFDSICKNYLKLASILQKSKLAEKKLQYYKKSLNSEPVTWEKPFVALFVSGKPLVGVSNVTYIGKIIKDAGGINSLRLLGAPYPKLSLEHLVNLNPDIVISILYHTGTNSDSLKKSLTDFPKLKVMKRDSIYSLKADNICLYTPGDYVKSVKQVSHIIKMEKRKLHEQ